MGKRRRTWMELDRERERSWCLNSNSSGWFLISTCMQASVCACACACARVHVCAHHGSLINIVPCLGPLSNLLGSSPPPPPPAAPRNDATSVLMLVIEAFAIQPGQWVLYCSSHQVPRITLCSILMVYWNKVLLTVLLRHCLPRRARPHVKTLGYSQYLSWR